MAQEAVSSVKLNEQFGLSGVQEADAEASPFKASEYDTARLPVSSILPIGYSRILLNQHFGGAARGQESSVFARSEYELDFGTPYVSGCSKLVGDDYHVRAHGSGQVRVFGTEPVVDHQGRTVGEMIVERFQSDAQDVIVPIR